MMTTIPYTVVLHKRFNQQNFGVYIGDDIPSGLYVVTVEPNSSAADANIQPGDRVLAVNGQSVSSMSKNPKDMIVQIAKDAESLTLSIQPSNILKTIGILSTNNNSHRYFSQQNNGFDHELENYLKSIFNENLQITPSSSSNGNEYILTSNAYSYRPSRHRKRRARKTVETQTSINDEQQKENSQPLSQHRSIPSMGTPHVILRNSQLSSKDNGTNESSEIKPLPNFNSSINKSDSNIDEKANHIFEPISAKQSLNSSSKLSNTRIITNENFQQPSEVASRPSSLINDGLREVRIHRSQTFNGFGFHIQYNRMYYLIHKIEPNSPAEDSGLRVNDVILKINNQTTDEMSHKTFVEIVYASTDVTFLVQNYDNYILNNPQALRPRTTDTTVNNDNKKGLDRQKSVLSKAFNRLTSRQNEK